MSYILSRFNRALASSFPRFTPTAGLAAGFMLIILVVTGVYFIQTQKITPKHLLVEQLADPTIYQNLPVTTVTSYPAQNSWGTVVFIPQTHKSPGSNPQDPINDSGARSQEEIRKLLSLLVDGAKISFIMVEGHLYGPISGEKITLLSHKREHRDELNRLLGVLQGVFNITSVNTSLERILLQSLRYHITKMDREIILEGAAENLVAQGKAITLYGSENSDTIEESKPLVRDLIYLQDRLKQLNNKSIIPDKQLVSSVKIPEEKVDFEPLYSEASKQGRNDITNLIDKIKTFVTECETQIPEKIMITPSLNTPSRADNPYQTIENKEELQSRIKKTKTNIQDVVIDKRNRETAQNFARGLKTENKNLGILQFGAGHEKGLIKELNNLGLKVIVVKTQEVAQRQ